MYRQNAFVGGAGSTQLLSPLILCIDKCILYSDARAGSANAPDSLSSPLAYLLPWPGHSFHHASLAYLPASGDKVPPATPLESHHLIQRTTFVSPSRPVRNPPAQLNPWPA